jgi:hypothetical protein
MDTLSTGLIADGSSDQSLIPLLTTLLGELLPETRIETPQWIAPTNKNALSEKIAYALDPENFQFDILFVHRDAENETIAKRVEEISQSTPAGKYPIVCVIPVKMTESWLITSDKVIKEAVGNSHSQAKLALPAQNKIESCDSKTVLLAALTEASEYGAQRRRKFKPEQFRHRVAELTTDLTALRKISSFKKMENALIDILEERGIPHVEV